MARSRTEPVRRAPRFRAPESAELFTTHAGPEEAAREEDLPAPITPAEAAALSDNFAQSAKQYTLPMRSGIVMASV